MQGRYKYLRRTCKPNSVPSLPLAQNAKGSTGVIISLGAVLTPTALRRPFWDTNERASLSPTSLAPGGVYRAPVLTFRAVGSYPAISPLPKGPCGALRRYHFCGTFRCPPLRRRGA